MINSKEAMRAERQNETQNRILSMKPACTLKGQSTTVVKFQRRVPVGAVSLVRADRQKRRNTGAQPVPKWLGTQPLKPSVRFADTGWLMAERPSSQWKGT